MKRRGATVAGVVVFVAVTMLASGVESQDGWQWSVAPYMWATDVSGDLILDGDVGGGRRNEMEGVR